MANQVTITQEGTFNNTQRTQINNMFSELYSDVALLSAQTASFTVTAANSGTLFALNAAAGMAVTLPAATGTGNHFGFVITTTITSNSTTIKVANSTDVIAGVATMGSAGGTSLSTGTTSTGAVSGQSDTITFNGTTTGGIIGSYVDIYDVATGIFLVEVHGVCSGTAATPFSATV